MPKIFDALSLTRKNINRDTLADDAFKELEEGLLLADCGTKTTALIVDSVRAKVGENFDLAAFGNAVREATTDILAKMERPAPEWKTKPHVILLVGTNGGGKTTTSAKLAHLATSAKKSVVLAAADTFRAAAGEQLQTLADRIDGQVQVVSDRDPGAAAFNAVATGVRQQSDLVIVDTAGRQPTSKALMDEARKVRNAINKAMPQAPHETLLAIDANTGQNALRQVEAFDQALGLTGIALTKLDSTARGGVIFAIGANHDLPLRFVGVGEGIEDCVPFDAKQFTTALFTDNAT